MKKWASIALVAAGLLLAACATPSTPTPQPHMMPAFRPTPRVPNRAYYTKRCWPACHYERVSELEHPSVCEFDGALEPEWQWVNEDPANWTLTEAPGVLRIMSQNGTISEGLENARNVLVQDAPSGHFDIVTQVTFAPTQNHQSAAIFVQLEDGSLVSLYRGYCEESEAPYCTGSGVYFDGSDLGCAPASLPTSAETVFLMLRKAGRAYIGYYRLEDEDWTEVGRCNSETPPTTVGLTSINGDTAAPSIPADFDFFMLQERR